MIHYFINVFITLPIIIFLHLYLFLANFLNYFFNSKEKMKNIFYKNYFYYVTKIFMFLGIYNKIEFNNCSICKNSKNLLIENHNSILDFFIFGCILNNNKMSFLDLKTVSKPQSNIEKSTLEMFDCLIVSEDNNITYKNINKIKDKLKKSKKSFVISLSPEGTIFNKKDKLTSKQIDYLKKNNIKIYKNVLFPHIGIFNLLIEKIKFDNIYVLSTLYKINNRRLIDEEEILLNLNNPNLKILFSFEKFRNNKNINDKWLLKIWENIDSWIETKLKE